METRSQRRLAQEQLQQQQHRPSYPQLQTTQSTPASAFQSSSSLASVGSINMNSQQQHLQPQQSGFASAPLPSPSAAHQSSTGYFNMAACTSHPAQQARIPPQMQGGFVGQRGGGSGGAPETAPFLQDFSLVAEAAKRAQMACLARDLGDVGL